MYGYYREKLHDNHLWEWKGLESGGGEKGEKGHSFEWVACLIYDQGCGCLFGGGSLLEYGHLFEKNWDVEFSLT